MIDKIINKVKYDKKLIKALSRQAKRMSQIIKNYDTDKIIKMMQTNKKIMDLSSAIVKGSEDYDTPIDLDSTALLFKVFMENFITAIEGAVEDQKKISHKKEEIKKSAKKVDILFSHELIDYGLKSLELKSFRDLMLKKIEKRINSSPKKTWMQDDPVKILSSLEDFLYDIFSIQNELAEIFNDESLKDKINIFRDSYNLEKDDVNDMGKYINEKVGELLDHIKENDALMKKLMEQVEKMGNMAKTYNYNFKPLINLIGNDNLVEMNSDDYEKIKNKTSLKLSYKKINKNKNTSRPSDLSRAGEICEIIIKALMFNILKIKNKRS